ncbi:hypothetical protein G9A89_018408 [Geosiphon pyriformis]|nr:hypothetical protein G9A89_018408 [Geosiphon pyriformis]
MVYAPIAKLDNFTGEENNTQVWLNDVEKAITANGWNDTRAMQAISYFLKNTANLWYQSLINKPQNFNAFKVEFLRYFSNNNSINHLVNMFTTIKQEETEAVTTYLGRFHQNLCQIQAIDTNYFTAPQIFNQFIRGLHSSILQHLEANHTQAINLVINGSSELDSKLEKFTTITLENLRPRITQNWRSAIVVHQPISSLSNQQIGFWQQNLGTSTTQNPNSQHYLSFLVTPEDATSSNLESNQQTTLTNNIPPATVTNNESLAAIFPFELEEPFQLPLFSRATLKEKPITVMYTDVKVDRHPIKFILDSGSASSIITKQLMDQLSRRVDRTVSARIITADGTTRMPIGKINDFPIEVNGIVTPIKVLVIKATQYQALVGNDWLVKTNAVLDWTTQELQLSQNGQHTRVPIMCGHFKTTNLSAPLIDFEEQTKPIWEAYQVLWANPDHNELLPILSWNDNSKEKQKEELIWETDDLTRTDNEQKKPSNWEWKEEKGKGKKREEENTQANNTYIPYTYG